MKKYDYYYYCCWACRLFYNKLIFLRANVCARAHHCEHLIDKSVCAQPNATSSQIARIMITISMVVFESFFIRFNLYVFGLRLRVVAMYHN